MSEWSESYRKAHAALSDAYAAIKHLTDSTDAPDVVKDQLCCAGNSLQGARALLDEAGQLKEVPRPRVALDVKRILKLTRLRAGRKARMEWDSGTDVYKALESMHSSNSKEAVLLMNALFEGLFRAKDRGLFAPAHEW